jgi:hypothetical protein
MEPTRNRRRSTTGGSARDLFSDPFDPSDSWSFVGNAAKVDIDEHRQSPRPCFRFFREFRGRL